MFAKNEKKVEENELELMQNEDEDDDDVLPFW